MAHDKSTKPINPVYALGYRNEGLNSNKLVSNASEGSDLGL